MIGSTVSHYRIVDSLGSGGMGVVYLAEDITLGRKVALKFLSSTTPEYRNRFLREARAVSRLVHPNIATVFDYGETDADHGERPKGTPYIVMELVKGTPLNEKLEAGPLPLREAVRIVSAIAEGLGEAHRQGVVHRDVKPSNVVVSDNGQVKVLDFGLVKQIHEEAGPNEITARLQPPESRTRSDVIVGTPLYLSPEQATGKQVDQRSDLFTLGAVLYECITGQSAFTGSSVIEIGAQVIYVTPKPPSKLNSFIPAELDKITMRALEKKPEARYQNANEFIKDLQGVIPRLPENDPGPDGRSTRSQTRARTHSASALTTINETFRRPRLSLATFILAFLAIGIVAWLVYEWRKPRPYQPTAVALDFYNKGTDALRNGAFLQASKAFEQAIANDSKFSLAHARLAEAFMELDYADRAKDAMLRVQALVPDRSALASTDSLHLEAINATVSKDFPGAINAYQELVKLSPDDPQVYVDLGRAHEKNDDLKKAIESYVDATNRTPQYASAFLRVAILYGRQGDQSSAAAAFDKADGLYQANGNFEGQAEVAYQRGFLFNQLDRVNDARHHLQRALEIAKTTGNDYQQVKTLLKLGDVEMEAGAREVGRQYMRDAFELAKAKGIDNYTKRALVDLGNSFILSGDYPEAEKYLKESLELSQRQKDPRNSARALLALGSLEERRLRPDAAVGYIEQAMPFYQQGGYRKETTQALHLLGRAKTQKGEYDAALKTFRDLLAVTQQLGDPAQIAFVNEDLGLIRLTQGRYPDALLHFEESYKIGKSLGIQKTVSVNLLNRANTLWRLGRFDEARAALDEAAAVAEDPQAAKNISASYYLARSRVAMSEGNFGEARSHANKSLSLAGQQLKATAITATYTLGKIDVLSGAVREGGSKAKAAITMARDGGSPFLVSEALITLADAQVHNQEPDALTTAVEANRLVAGFGNHDYEWLTLILAARAARTKGDLQQARDFATKANSILSSLKEEWGNDNYNSYLNRADVQISRKQLNDFLAENP
ncbi:MAG TPA: tetratricopeptide repeat protein [Pyrinomonadaceae bacterium]|nr:tetratricopeptide repeat protein [Pyrinomonadaceae bacterium]